ncbi:hypothetical protein F5H01DRAFT_54981 [Linnemannia elongata]|nr:hypothetical protein F5H01DRAFT_54981 [Linnemannia elongata]
MDGVPAFASLPGSPSLPSFSYPSFSPCLAQLFWLPAATAALDPYRHCFCLCLFVFLCLQFSTTLFFRLSPPKRGSPQKTRLLPTLLRQQNKQRCTKGREKNENRKKTNKQTNNVRTESPSSALHSYSLPPNAYRKTNSPSFSTGHLQDKIIIHEHQAASTKRCLDHLTDPVPVLTLSSQSFLFTISLLFLKVTTFPIHGLHGVTRPVRRRRVRKHPVTGGMFPTEHQKGFSRLSGLWACVGCGVELGYCSQLFSNQEQIQSRWADFLTAVTLISLVSDGENDHPEPSFFWLGLLNERISIVDQLEQQLT